MAPDGGSVYVASMGLEQPETGYTDGVVLRLTPGAPPDRIGSGSALAVSEDGHTLAVTALESVPQAITVLDATTGGELVFDQCCGIGRLAIPDLGPDLGEYYPRTIQWHPDGRRLLLEAGSPEAPSELFVVDPAESTATRLGPPEGLTAGTGWSLAGTVSSDQVLVVESCCARDANSYAGDAALLWLDLATGAERSRESIDNAYTRGFVNSEGDVLLIDQCCGSPDARLLRRQPDGELRALEGPTYALVGW